MCVCVCVLDQNNVPSALFVALVSHPHVLWVSVFVSRRFIKELYQSVCVCVCVCVCVSSVYVNLSKRSEGEISARVSIVCGPFLRVTVMSAFVLLLLLLSAAFNSTQQDDIQPH